MKIRQLVTVSGLVQGVAFRHYTVRQAQLLGVNGWVRNLPDGRVQGCFEGDENAVAALVEWCRSGPPAARVTGLEVQSTPYTGEFQGFEVSYLL